MQDIFDLVLGNHKWYRKMIGGKWDRVSVPLFSGSDLVWMRAYKLNLEFRCMV